ncbi:iron complex transport system ATP-binding protein [Devosia sp. YR412]|uniref:ABC transporter ATP-binding protein n=1 Tax=Devosia sp. YR412 TaxID=1881030 RepID=UPI0008B988CE|nr:ABC transporter ATP-binding protein [Devosia sp. YR412]SEQ10491.1 iron complex transport system ATP-binding protein [Devosia sp. YR412]
MTRLQTHDLSAGYLKAPVLADINIAFPDGLVTALIGPNGSGKSTLLKTLARILSPERGTVLLDGKAIHSQTSKAVARTMGLLPQGPLAPEGLTVRELVAQGRFPHQSLLSQWSTQDQAAVERAMQVADVTSFAERPVDSLSGGQRQRCWVAMALAQETDLILLDEPTTFLDLKVQVELMELLRSLAHDAGRTLVIVLHELSLAAAYADHLVMLKEGKVVCAGEPSKVFTSAWLKEVFDLDANILTDPATGRRVCVPYANPKSS